MKGKKGKKGKNAGKSGRRKEAGQTVDTKGGNSKGGAGKPQAVTGPRTNSQTKASGHSVDSKGGPSKGDMARGFTFFCDAKRAEVTADLKTANLVEKKMGDMWKALSDAEKEPFNKMAVGDKEPYAKATQNNSKKTNKKKKQKKKNKDSNSDNLAVQVRGRVTTLPYPISPCLATQRTNFIRSIFACS